METSYDQFDRDASEASEARVVNVSDETVRLEIAQQPGSKPRRYVLTPWGTQQCSTHIQIGYTKPFRGAGRGLVTATVETLTEREMLEEIAPTMGPNGVVLSPGRRALRIPFVVSEDKADDARTAYEGAMKKRGEAVRNVKATEQPIVEWSTPPATRAAKPSREDVEDQGGALDEPPPDDDMPPVPVISAPSSAQPEPVTIPKGPTQKKDRNG